MLAVFPFLLVETTTKKQEGVIVRKVIPIVQHLILRKLRRDFASAYRKTGI